MKNKIIMTVLASSFLMGCQSMPSFNKDKGFIEMEGENVSFYNENHNKKIESFVEENPDLKSCLQDSQGNIEDSDGYKTYLFITEVLNDGHKPEKISESLSKNYLYEDKENPAEIVLTNNDGFKITYKDITTKILASSMTEQSYPSAYEYDPNLSNEVGIIVDKVRYGSTYSIFKTQPGTFAINVSISDLVEINNIEIEEGVMIAEPKLNHFSTLNVTNKKSTLSFGSVLLDSDGIFSNGNKVKSTFVKSYICSAEVESPKYTEVKETE